jgi:hypothetical protein
MICSPQPQPTTTKPNNHKGTTMPKTTLPDGTVRIPDRVFADLQRDAHTVTVWPTGQIILSFADGVVCECERTHPRNVNQWTVTSRSAIQGEVMTKDPATKEQRAEVARLRKSLNDGRREFKIKLRDLNAEGNRLFKAIKLVESECRSVNRDLEVFERRMNREIERTLMIPCEVSSSTK